MRMTRQCSRRDENSGRAPVSGWCRSFSLLAVLAVLATVGCQSRSYDVAEVSGRVTLDGNPLADAQVMFQPVATADKNASPGPGSWGKTDSDGRYRLEIVEPEEPGAVVGTHRVTITTAAHSENPADDSAAAMPKETLPKSCRDGSIRMEVPAGGTDEADIEIKSR